MVPDGLSGSSEVQLTVNSTSAAASMAAWSPFNSFSTVKNPGFSSTVLVSWQRDGRCRADGEGGGLAVFGDGDAFGGSPRIAGPVHGGGRSVGSASVRLTTVLAGNSIGSEVWPPVRVMVPDRVVAVVRVSS